MAILSDVVTFGGREYVSRTEFARRKNVTVNRIRYLIVEGKLDERSIYGYATKFLDWEASSAQFDMIPSDGRKKEARREKKNSKYMNKPSESISAPTIAPATIPVDTMSDIDKMPEKIDASGFDKKIYSDCIGDDGEFDYEKLKNRLTAEKYQIAVQQAKGQLVEKNDIIIAAKSIALICETGFKSIPQQFGAVLIAKVQGIIEKRIGESFEFSDEERTSIRNELNDVPGRLMRSLQVEIGKLADEE